jgi:hypothetical protein
MRIDEGKRFIVCANEMLTAFLELESAIRNPGVHFRQQVEKLAVPMHVPPILHAIPVERNRKLYTVGG